MEELIKAAEGMLAALPESDHEKYGGYRYGCTCPRCRLVMAVSNAKGEPPPKYLQRSTWNDQKILDHVSKTTPFNDNDSVDVTWGKRVLLAYHLGMLT
jgi:hypothetical protein